MRATLGHNLKIPVLNSSELVYFGEQPTKINVITFNSKGSTDHLNRHLLFNTQIFVLLDGLL